MKDQKATQSGGQATNKKGMPYQQGYVLGKYGANGSHSHILRVIFTEDADPGKPWSMGREVYSALPLCNAGKGRHNGHSISWDADLSMKTVTCEGCRKATGLLTETE